MVLGLWLKEPRAASGRCGGLQSGTCPLCSKLGGGAEMEESDGTGFTLALSGVSGPLSEINKSLKLRPAD